MRLFSALALRLSAVVLFCLILTTVWIVSSSYHAMDAAKSETASRVEKHLKGLYWQALLWRDGLSKETLLPQPIWRTPETQSIIAPGVCVTFAPPRGSKDMLCSQDEAIGPVPPAWFSGAYTSLLGSHRPVTKFLSIREKKAGSVKIFANEGAALRLAWGQVSALLAIASVMAGGIAVLTAITIGHALLPAQAIIRTLHKLERGDLSGRLPQFNSSAFSSIAGAVNDLSEQLLRARNESRALTTRLFQVQEEERRAIARDLHDEFGQSLTATAALAALIEANTGDDHNEIAKDARAITSIQKDMMETLRTTLVRLRSQNIEEVGLEASLRQLVSDYNTQTSVNTNYSLEVSGRLAALHKRIAVDVYRIAQECLTNATRHGNPSDVRVRVEQCSDGGNHVALTVEDDGGGDVANFNASIGHGIIGMRERIAALGGALCIANISHGIRISATIPLQVTYPMNSSVRGPA